MNLIMTFSSAKVGEFLDQFFWRLEGTSQLLNLTVRGYVQAPKFQFSKQILDFRTVSFQFEKTEKFSIINSSTVPFEFELRIPQDGKGSEQEFNIIPSKASINPGEDREIKIKFVPFHKKVYKNVLVLDITGIGRDMKSIPILAQSEVPRVSITPQVLNFEDIFLRYQKTMEIELRNESPQFARFIVHRPSTKFEQVALIQTDLDKGQISPNSVLKLKVTLNTLTIKFIEIDFSIEIVSEKNIQQTI